MLTAWAAGGSFEKDSQLADSAAVSPSPSTTLPLQPQTAMSAATKKHAALRCFIEPSSEWRTNMTST